MILKMNWKVWTVFTYINVNYIPLKVGTELFTYELPHDKTKKMTVHPSAKSDQSLCCLHEESLGP